MTVDAAFKKLIETEEFKLAAKQRTSAGSRYRMALKRFKDGQIKTGAMVDLLIAHGYTITANKAVKKPTKKGK